MMPSISSASVRKLTSSLFMKLIKQQLGAVKRPLGLVVQDVTYSPGFHSFRSVT